MSDLCILATGGTIDKVHDPVSETLTFSDKSYVPDVLERCKAQDIPHQVLMLKDSMDVTDEDRALIKDTVLARPEKAIVITHGTSTMPKTAEYLEGVAPDKVIILTGAFRPFSLFQSDAGFNLGAAIIAARTLSPGGVYVVMNGEIFEAGTVKKNSAESRFERIG